MGKNNLFFKKYLNSIRFIPKFNVGNASLKVFTSVCKCEAFSAVWE